MSINAAALSRVFGGVALKDFALVIRGAPEIDHLAIQFDVNLVEMPPPVPYPAHRMNALVSGIGRKHWPEPFQPARQRSHAGSMVRNESHCIVENVDATLEEQAFGIPQRQWKADLHHHIEAGHLRRGVEATEWAARLSP